MQESQIATTSTVAAFNQLQDTDYSIESTNVLTILAPEPLDKNKEFWGYSEKGKFEFYHDKFIQFLELKGFRTVKIGGTIELVRIKDCIVSKIQPSDVKRFLINYLDGKTDITQYIISYTSLFSLHYLDALKLAELKMHRDTKNSAFHYYKNGVVEVTAKEIKPTVPYNQFKKLVWEDHIIQRDFDNTITDCKESIFVDFLTKLADNKKDRLRREKSLIGYCLHDHRTTANTRAVIINDEIVGEAPEGGSGKSLLFTALAQIRKSLEIDGKKFDPKHDFAWQNVNESIRLIHIDDAARGFNFENLFSAITAGFEINRKNKPQYKLQLEDSPIIVITTNCIIKGYSGSFARRQYSLDIHQYFNKNHTPQDEYNCIFFKDWNSKEWALFDMLMMQCIKLYLSDGITECSEIDHQKKNAIRSTNNSFVDWFEESIHDFTNINGIPTSTARDSYLSDSGQRSLKFSSKKFLKYVESYCKIYSHNYIKTDGRPRGFRIEINPTPPVTL